VKVESLERLSAAVAEWRKEKKHRREKMPGELLVRIRLAARTHGVNALVRGLRVDRRRLEAGRQDEPRGGGPASAPKYSRVELAGLGAGGRCRRSRSRAAGARSTT
jgi:hypothetical protein